MRLVGFFFLSFFSLCVLAGFPAEADISKAPFEKCDWTNKSYAERLVRDSSADDDSRAEAQFCPQCGPAAKSAGRQEGFIETMQKIMERELPPECFLASAARSIQKEASRKTYYYCDSPEDKKTDKVMAPLIDPKGKTRRMYPRAPCLNEDYIMMTFRAFHSMARCFGFTPQEKKYIFALFNHESSFILNQKSHRGARCHGQLSADTAAEVNKRIYLSGNPEPHSSSQIYNEALKKCPNLPESVLLQDEIMPAEGKSRTYKGFKRIRKKLRVSCRLTQHAPTCFFYSMYNIKINLNQIERILSLEPGNIPQNMDLPNDMKRHFPLPIRLNEALVVKGMFREGGSSVEEGGKTVYREWVVRDAYQLYTILYDTKTGKPRRGYSPADLEIKKIPLYDIDQKVKWSFVYQAHNGGLTMIKDKLKTFIENGKEAVALGSFCDERKNAKKAECSNKPARRHRARIKEGKPLAFNMPAFQEKLSSEEVRNFLSQIHRDVNYLNNEDSEKSKPLSRHLRRLSANTRAEKFKKEKRGEETIVIPPEISPERNSQIEEFVKSIKGKCFEKDMLL